MRKSESRASDSTCKLLQLCFVSANTKRSLSMMGFSSIVWEHARRHNHP